MITRILSAVLGICILTGATAQTAIPIPDTLSGSSIVLTMHRDSVQFFPGQLSQTYAFNQYKYLGPTLILRKGQNVSILVNNQIGDTTTVHWHGMHVAAVNDGGPHTMIMNGMSWNPQFTVLDRAAMYWYHPHFHGKTAKQAIKGAAGVIIVRDSAEAELNLPRTYGVDDYPIIVQCQQYDANNQAMPLGMQDSTLLVNGTINPMLAIPAQVVRLRLLNASGERTFNFGFTGNKTFKVIGSDGGLLNAPISTTRIKVSPGERYEVLLDVSGMNGQTIYLMSYGSEIPMGTQGGPTMPMPPGNPPMDSPLNGVDYNILKLNVVAPTPNAITTTPTGLVTVTPWQTSQANITRPVNFSAQNMMSMDGPFYMNGQLFDMMRIDYHIPLDNVEIWSLTNQTMVAHPFHMHDVQFYVLDRDGNPPPAAERGRKDVVLVAPNETVRFITKFETFADTGTAYMFHCHILMHEDAGMMGQFVVVPKTTGIIEIPANGIKMYPNPANDQLNLVLPAAMPFSYSIINASGQKVVSAKGQQNNIDVSTLTGGLYQLLIEQNNKHYQSKFLKL